MRTARLAALALATAALTACGNAPTGPATATPSDQALKTGWLTSTGSRAPSASSADACRAGWLTSTGRCE